jgi:hypothetical protein
MIVSHSDICQKRIADATAAQKAFIEAFTAGTLHPNLSADAHEVKAEDGASSRRLVGVGCGFSH